MAVDTGLFELSTYTITSSNSNVTEFVAVAVFVTTAASAAQESSTRFAWWRCERRRQNGSVPRVSALYFRALDGGFGLR